MPFGPLWGSKECLHGRYGSEGRYRILVAATVGAVCASILFVVPIRPIRIDTLVPAGGVTQKIVYFQDK